MAMYIGIDGGGTKTRALLFNTEDQSRVSVDAGPTNPNTVGWDASQHTIVDLIQRLIAISESSECPRGLSIGMAGVDRPDQKEQMTAELLEQLGFHAAMEVVNDALPALTAGTQGESGVVLIAGTGSIAVGENEQGDLIRSGGFGSLIGDEGSGFDIGRQGLMAAIQSQEHRGRETALWDRVVRHFRIATPHELIPAIYSSVHPVSAVASFAPHVLELASTDAVASDIVEYAVHHFQGLIDSTFRRFTNPPQRHVVLSGGLFLHAPLLYSKLAARMLDTQFQTLNRDVSTGAVLRAIRLVHDANGITAWKETFS